MPKRRLGAQMFGEPDLERLWKLVDHLVRLDEDDPVAAWQEHVGLARRPGRWTSCASTRSTSSGRAPI